MLWKRFPCTANAPVTDISPKVRNTELWCFLLLSAWTSCCTKGRTARAFYTPWFPCDLTAVHDLLRECIHIHQQKFNATSARWFSECRWSTIDKWVSRCHEYAKIDNTAMTKQSKVSYCVRILDHNLPNFIALIKECYMIIVSTRLLW